MLMLIAMATVRRKELAKHRPAGYSLSRNPVPAMPLFTVSKSIRIAAPVQQVYGLVREGEAVFLDFVAGGAQ